MDKSPEKGKKSYLGLIMILAIYFIVFVVLPEEWPITILLKAIAIPLAFLGLAATNKLDYAFWILTLIAIIYELVSWYGKLP